MKHQTVKNTIEFEVFGNEALFTDPLSRLGEEKVSLSLPTYSAIKGIADSIYFKPTFQWVIDEIRIMNPIRMISKGVKPLKTDLVASPSNYTYLYQPRYQVRMHFEWDDSRPDLAQDRNDAKHYAIAKRSLKQGGRFPIFLGTKECFGYVEPCTFGEGEGYYDNVEELAFGLMLHGVTYPTSDKDKMLKSRFYNPVMKNGFIQFPRPDECSIVTNIREITPKSFSIGKNLRGVEEEYEMLIGGEGE